MARAQRVGVREGQAELAAHLRWSLTTLLSSPPMYWAGVFTRGRRRRISDLSRLFVMDHQLKAK